MILIQVETIHIQSEVQVQVILLIIDLNFIHFILLLNYEQNINFIFHNFCFNQYISQISIGNKINSNVVLDLKNSSNRGLYFLFQLTYYLLKEIYSLTIVKKC